MPTVLIHGVPETPIIWTDFVQCLDRPVTLLHLPGFGRGAGPALPDKDAYADWLAGELRGLGGPIDLLAHGWGGHLATRVVTAYDVPVRSWITDVLGTWHAQNSWHPVARLWQSDQAEASLRAVRDHDTATIERLYGVPASGMAPLLVGQGMPEDLAVRLEAEVGDDMIAAILALYRSAYPNLWTSWGRQLPERSPVPGLALSPTAHPWNNQRQTAEMADRLGMALHSLEGLGHSWMATDPQRLAPMVTAFWMAHETGAGHAR